MLSITRNCKSRVKLAVTLWLSGIVIDWTFTLGSVDVRARLFVGHCRINNHVLIFRS